MQGLPHINEAIQQGQQIGKGQFSQVYKGYSLKQGRIIAIKHTSKKRSIKWEREKQIMELLNQLKHPNIMEYYGCIQQKQEIYFLLQYCAGGTLIKQDDNERFVFSELKTVQIFSEILSAMVYLHSKDILHRDLKLENILLDENQKVKIADFGLARGDGTDKTRVVGTPIYEAPEILEGSDYSKSCDVWSAGLVLYELLTGERYFEGVTKSKQLLLMQRQLMEGKRKIELPNLEKQWHQIIECMLQSEDKRPHFHELQQNFNKVKQNLIERIKLKYKYTSPVFKDLNMLMIPEQISPYRSLTHPRQKTIVELQKQQKSFQKLLFLSSYLHVFTMKNILIELELSEFMKKQDIKDNQHLIINSPIFSFLLKTIHFARIHILNNTFPFQIYDRKWSKGDFIPEHEKYAEAMLKGFKDKQQKRYNMFRGATLKKTLIEKQAVKEYLTNKLPKVGNILELAVNANQNKFQTEKAYMQAYRKLIALQQIYVHNEQLQKLELIALKRYATMRIIANIDKVFLYPEENSNQNLDYFYLKKQEIYNKNRESLIEMIKEMN